MNHNITLRATAGEDEKPGDVKCVLACVGVCSHEGRPGNEMISKSYQEELRWHIGIHYQAAFNQETRRLSGEVKQLGVSPN